MSTLHSQHIQDLDYVSAVPIRNVLRSSSQFARIFILLVCGAIAVSIILAAIRARKDYESLENVLDLLSHPDQALIKEGEPSEAFLDTYNYITYNIINLFIQQDY